MYLFETNQCKHMSNRTYIMPFDCPVWNTHVFLLALQFFCVVRWNFSQNIYITMIAYYYMFMCVCVCLHGFHAIYITFGHNSSSRAPDVHSTQKLIEIIFRISIQMCRNRSTRSQRHTLIRFVCFQFLFLAPTTTFYALYYKCIDIFGRKHRLGGDRQEYFSTYSLGVDLQRDYIFGNQFWHVGVQWKRVRDWNETRLEEVRR